MVPFRVNDSTLKHSYFLFKQVKIDETVTCKRLGNIYMIKQLGSKVHFKAYKLQLHKHNCEFINYCIVTLNVLYMYDYVGDLLWPSGFIRLQDRASTVFPLTG